MAYGDVTTLNRIRQEYEEGRSYLETKKQRWVAQLQMLNNLQRGSQTIASTMLLSFFLRVFSNLYSNVMTVKFVGTDAEMRKTEGLNFLARNDAQEMDKATIDYDNIWDACAFGAGYRETLDYDKDRMLMKPVTINPLFLSYDPFFSNPQQWRYYSKWILRPQHEIERLIDDGIIDGVSSIKDIETGVDPYIWQWQIQVEQARLANPVGTETLVDPTASCQLEKPVVVLPPLPAWRLPLMNPAFAAVM